MLKLQGNGALVGHTEIFPSVTSCGTIFSFSSGLLGTWGRLTSCLLHFPVCNNCQSDLNMFFSNDAIKAFSKCHFSSLSLSYLCLPPPLILLCTIVSPHIFFTSVISQTTSSRHSCSSQCRTQLVCFKEVL